ncbi:extracellular serine proteinase-like [Amphiura filiformis]|uniref:extracellular serine proteinase-like n=1 Tax=Amphiura filiformis TaxID=82378 RepID=UPI003B21648C
MSRLVLLAICLCVVGLTGCLAMPTWAPFYTSEDAIKESYLIVLEDNANSIQVSQAIQSLANRQGLRFAVKRRFSALFNGLHVSMNELVVDIVRSHASVKYIEADGPVYADEATWGLDRIDQRSLPLDDVFDSSGDGAGSHVYILDTGIRVTHEEFEGRATFVYDAMESEPGQGTDCRGHGTHCAGTASGAQYGVAKKSNVYAVRVLGCNGSGSKTTVITGMEWVANNGIRPAVASMSLGGSGSRIQDDAVKALYDSGVSVVVSAGNDDFDACFKSPARAPHAITVGASEDDDERAYFSNYGGCVDIFAPGRYITSSCYESDDDYCDKSGTSMAAPHVAGVVALLLGADPSLTPADVTSIIINTATRDKVIDAKNSPNLLLYTY